MGAGFELKYIRPDGSFDAKQISSEVKNIAERNRAAYPNLKPDVSKLEFDSNIKFVKSYLTMIRQLNLTKAE